MAAVIHCARAISCGEGEIMIAAGMEHMTRGPYVMSKSSTAFGTDAKLYDSSFGWRFINPRHGLSYMALTRWAKQQKT